MSERKDIYEEQSLKYTQDYDHEMVICHETGIRILDDLTIVLAQHFVLCHVPVKKKTFLCKKKKILVSYLNECSVFNMPDVVNSIKTIAGPD